MSHNIPYDELIAELKSVADLLGHAPSLKEFEKFGAYSCAPYKKRFGDWSNTLNAAGLDMPESTTPISKQDLLNDFERVGRKLGKTPTSDDIDEHGEYASWTYKQRFDNWHNLVEISVFEVWEMPSGKDHPAWSGGHDNYYGPNWKQNRKKALERDEYQCQACNMTQKEHATKYGQGLHVHHIIPQSNFDDYEKQNALNNLITLCRKCHSKYEGWNLRPDV